MASKTTNYNLDMPGYNEVADIDVINGNMDKIDVQMKKNADSAQQSKDIVSDEYSATNTYAVGDYCIHENILYKCKTAITTGEAFDSNKWVQTTCGTEFKELNSNLDGLEYSDVAGGKNLFNKNYVYDGYPDNTTGLPNGSTTYGQVTSDEIKVKPNGKYIKNSFNNANFPNSFFDENHNFIRREETSSFITVPSNAHYIRVCLSKSEIDTFQFEEGTTSTPYEPYIPSVKMLAEEVSAQKNDLGGLSLSVSGTTLSITDGTNTWTLSN